ncbi:MAG: hypothetical protein LQ345_004632 [Seirophora villosa]|nr:MAG: hypothetical protein LQ345_004632 [Seirophora villosa]
MPPSSSFPTPTALPRCTCPDPPDSPLSTTANVVSILTFAFALLASYIALQSATRGAPAEIQRLVDDLRATQREINRTAEYIFSDMHREGDSASTTPEHPAGLPPATRTGYAAAPPSSSLTSSSSPTHQHQTLLYQEVQHLLKTSITLFYEADDLLKRSERDPYGFRRRALFLVNRDGVAEKMARLEGQKARLGDIRTSLSLRRSAQQEVLLRRIANSWGVKEGQDGVKGGRRQRRKSVD